MTENKTFGHFGKQLGKRCEYLTLAFSPLSAPLRSRWRNNGLSADFLGDYVTTFLPARGSTTEADGRQTEIKYAVTYIANELLENAMKYHERDVDTPIGIHLELTGDQITVSASNGISARQADHYRAFFQHILQEDAGDLLVRQLEVSTSDESNRSCLGLLTMITDYRAQLGWSFETHPVHPELMTVTTSAILDLKHLPGATA